MYNSSHVVSGSMNNPLPPPWGTDSIRLRLPGSQVVVSGISDEQYRIIARDYGLYVESPSAALSKNHVICRAGRLERPIGFSLEYFSVNGQYTLRKRRAGPEIEIMGIDFIGHIARGLPGTVQTTLWVEKEDELVKPIVLENFLRILLAHCVLDQGGVLLHSVGVVHRDRAYLFTGRSNVGKTTLAHKAAFAGARVLSDDINLVIPENGAFRAHKVPFTGEFGRRAENIPGNASFPLGGLVLLEKAPELTATSVGPADGVAGLLVGCPFVNDDPEEFSLILNILTKLVSDTPIVRLGVGREDPFEAIMDKLLKCELHD